MNITSDWHIHSRNSCDGACMKMADLVADAKRSGIAHFGVSDHLHTPYNLPDIERSLEEYRSTEPGSSFHFGIEVSCISRWELDEIASGRHENPVYGVRSGGPVGGPLAIGIDSEDIERLGIEYVIGGTHWPMYVQLNRSSVIADYHRQNMFLATHPLVDIVAHPWWWMGHWQDCLGKYLHEPWFDDFRIIPSSMHEEFASAAKEGDTKMEVNISALLLNPNYPERFATQYLEYLADLQGNGVQLCIGSDCHDARYEIAFGAVNKMIEQAGIADDFWALPPKGSNNN